MLRAKISGQYIDVRAREAAREGERLRRGDLLRRGRLLLRGHRREPLRRARQTCSRRRPPNAAILPGITRDSVLRSRAPRRSSRSSARGADRPRRALPRRRGVLLRDRGRGHADPRRRPPPHRRREARAGDGGAAAEVLPGRARRGAAASRSGSRGWREARRSASSSAPATLPATSTRRSSSAPQDAPPRRDVRGLRRARARGRGRRRCTSGSPTPRSWASRRSSPALGRFLASSPTATAASAARRPTSSIPVDYPGFNVRLARLARRRGVPVCYHVVPQYWAWAPWRARRLARRRSTSGWSRSRSRQEFFAKAGLATTFVGHPLADRLADAPAAGGRDGAHRRTPAGQPAARDRGEPPWQLAAARKLASARRRGRCACARSIPTRRGARRSRRSRAARRHGSRSATSRCRRCSRSAASRSRPRAPRRSRRRCCASRPSSSTASTRSCGRRCPSRCSRRTSRSPTC